MPPISGADNGGFAWLLTFRPRPENFTDDLVDAVTEFITTKLDADWHWVVKEKGNHLHAAIFLHKPQQRPNIITKFIGDPRYKTSYAPLRHWSDEEKKNFSRYDRERKTGAVINMTTLGAVASYLSGEFDSKLGDDFEVISQKLPPAEDISELEQYLPAVDGLKRKRQISVWYAQQEEYFNNAKKERTIPEITDAPLSERTLVYFLQHRMWVARDMENLADQRILQQKARALLGYMQKVATGRYTDPKLKTYEDADQEPCTRCHHCSNMDAEQIKLRRRGKCLNCKRPYEDCHC
jgi:hypothetical protein